MSQLAIAVIIVLGSLLVAAVSCLRWRREYANLTSAELKGKADLLLRRGNEGSFMVVTEKQSGHFVQFRKYIHSKGRFGLELGFPKAPWSMTYYDRVLKIVEDDGIPLVVQPTNDAPVTEFLFADFGRDTERLASTMARIFYEILDTPRDRRFRVQAEGINARDALVDMPQQSER